MLKPNYKDGSTLNLIGSISQAFNYETGFSPLKLLPPEKLKNSKNIVLLLIDGLGYEFLKKYGKNTIFTKHLMGKITTVFPSSTSAAMTSIYTGLSPQQHGMTGWHMFMKELGDIIIPLPYVIRFNKGKISEKVDINSLFNLMSFTDKINSSSYIVQSKEISDSVFSRESKGKKTKIISYTDMKDYFKQVKKLINTSKKKYVLAYYGMHDYLCHEKGTEHKETQTHFKKLCMEFELFLKSIESEKNTTLIVTADHGHIQCEKSKIIDIAKHSKLEECLSIPICGENRFVYCYLKPSKEKQFVNYVKTSLKHACNIYKSEFLVKKGYFGQGKIHPKFLDRIGDYTIIMKDNYTIYHYHKGQKNKYFKVGDHGGLNKEELFVPLIVINK